MNSILPPIVAIGDLSKRVWNKKEHWAPFSQIDGHLLNSAHRWMPDIEWRNTIDPFPAKLKFKGCTKWSGSVIFHWEDQDNLGRHHPMFFKDFILDFQEGHLHNGIINGLWKINKRGTNYGIKLTKVLSF